MMDITKEEFWNANYQETEEHKKSKLNGIIKRNKIMTISIVSFGIFTIANIILIYNFFKILNSL